MLQYATSVKVSPYNVKRTGKGLGVTTVVGCGVAVRGVCSDESDEHDKRGNIEAMVNRNIFAFIFRGVLPPVLLVNQFLKMISGENLKFEFRWLYGTL